MWCWPVSSWLQRQACLHFTSPKRQLNKTTKLGQAFDLTFSNLCLWKPQTFNCKSYLRNMQSNFFFCSIQGGTGEYANHHLDRLLWTNDHPKDCGAWHLFQSWDRLVQRFQLIPMTAGFLDYCFSPLKLLLWSWAALDRVCSQLNTAERQRCGPLNPSYINAPELW